MTTKLMAIDNTCVNPRRLTSHGSSAAPCVSVIVLVGLFAPLRFVVSPFRAFGSPIDVQYCIVHR